MRVLSQETQKVRNNRGAQVSLNMMFYSQDFTKMVGLLTYHQTGRMRLRNSIIAHTAAIDSRIRMRLRGTKTPCMSGDIHGHARLFITTITLSTKRLADPGKPIPVGIAAAISPDQVSRPTGRNLRMTRIGRSASAICRTHTSFENATHPRNSLGRIISDST